MHENTIASCKAGIGNKLLWMFCETNSAVIQGMDLPARGASSQH